MKTTAKFASISIIVMAILCGCASKPNRIAKKDAFPEMYNQRPLSILVLPPINMTTAAEAKEYYLTTIVEPLSSTGYYVFPVEVTTDVLKSVGLYDTEIVTEEHLAKLKEFIGADAVLFIKIVKWDTAYAVIAGNVTVGVQCALKSTTTFKTLWAYNGTIRVDTSGGSSGGGLIGLAVKAVVTAVSTSTTDYVPIARRVNYMVMRSMPYGKYHPAFDTDAEMLVIGGRSKTK